MSTAVPRGSFEGVVPKIIDNREADVVAVIFLHKISELFHQQFLQLVQRI
jgi:hypothetical protein